MEAASSDQEAVRGDPERETERDLREETVHRSSAWDPGKSSLV